MFDVEIVIFDVGKDRPRQPELCSNTGRASLGSSSAYSLVMRSRSAATSAVGRSIFMPFLTCEM